MNSKPFRLLDSAKILITGSTGFVGSHIVRLFVRKCTYFQIFKLDALTYAGNKVNLEDIDGAENDTFLTADINDTEAVNALFQKYRFNAVIHFAAEWHSDRSISDPLVSVKANFFGAMNLLDAAKENWKDRLKDKLFYYIGRDGVYGSLWDTGLSEKTPYYPNSPYSASKTSSDHGVRSYGETFNLPYNNVPNQVPEKLNPLFVHNVINERPLPMYGNGKYAGDWYMIEHLLLIFFSFWEKLKKLLLGILRNVIVNFV